MFRQTILNAICFVEQWEMRIDRKVLSSKYSDIFSLWWASTYHNIFGQADWRSQVHVLDLRSVQEKLCIILLDMVWRVVIIVHCSLWILVKFVISFFLQLRPSVNLATMVNYKRKNDNGQHLQILAFFVLLYDIMIILGIRNPWF